MQLLLINRIICCTIGLKVKIWQEEKMAMNIKNAAKNLEDVKEMNLSLIIKLMQKMKICSRAELAAASGLRQSTITNIMNELIQCGMVSETGNIKGRKGRRSIAISLNSQAFKVIGIRLTRTCFMVGRFDIAGNEDCVDTITIGAEQSAEAVIADIEKVLEHMIVTCNEKILGIGVAVPGPLIISEERIVFMTGRSGWENVRFRKYFADKFQIPVFIEHDANAGVLAEWWFGYNNLERGTFVYVAAGQGIGVGIAVDGKVLHGALGIAGELGHMSVDYKGPQCQCGNRGCLELYCSILSMIKNINDGILKGIPSMLSVNSTIQQIAEAVASHDKLATEVFERTAWFLGFGLASFVNLYNPDTIIIGDELSIMGDRLLEIVTQTIKSHVLAEIYENLQVRFTSFQRDPALIGAVALAVDKALLKPSSILGGE